MKGSDLNGGETIEGILNSRTCGVARRAEGVHRAPTSAALSGRPKESAGEGGGRKGERAEEERAS